MEMGILRDEENGSNAIFGVLVDLNHVVIKILENEYEWKEL